jgi:hypothetical protein
LDVAVHTPLAAEDRPLAQVAQVAQGAMPDADHVEPATHGGATMHTPPKK